MRISAKLATALAAAMLLLPVGVAHADSPDPAHGPGGDSSACSDGQVPGIGVETGGLTRLSIISVGVQSGTDPGISHIAYVDTCLSFTPPNVCLPFLGCTGLRYGIYDSVRLHNADCNGLPGVQQIHNNDPGNTINPIGHQNNCPDN